MSCGVLLVPIKWGANGTFSSATMPFPIGIRKLTRWRDYRMEKSRCDRSYRETRLCKKILKYDPNIRTRTYFENGSTLENLDFEFSTEQEEASKKLYQQDPYWHKSENYYVRQSFRRNLFYEDIVQGLTPLPPMSNCSLYVGQGDPDLLAHCPNRNSKESLQVIKVDEDDEDNLLWGQEYYIVTKNGRKRTMTNEQIEMLVNGDEDLASALMKIGYSEIASAPNPSKQYLAHYPIECYETTLVPDATFFTSILQKKGIEEISDAIILQSEYTLVNRFLNVKSYEEDAPKIVPVKDLLLKKLDRLEDYKGKPAFSPLNITQVYAKSYKTGKQHFFYPGLKWDPFHFACRITKNVKPIAIEVETPAKKQYYTSPEFFHCPSSATCQYTERVLFRAGRFYQRRLVPSPRLHVWLLEGGIGENFVNSKLLNMYSEAIDEPFHLLVPSYRGSRLFDVKNLNFQNLNVTFDDFQANMLLPPSFTSLDQASYDVLYLIKRFNEELYPRADSKHFLHANSYDSLWAQRVLSLNTSLVRGIILDSPVSPLFRLNTFGPIAEEQLVKSTYKLCQFDPYCSSKISNFDEFKAMIQSISSPFARNECIDIIERSLELDYLGSNDTHLFPSDGIPSVPDGSIAVASLDDEDDCDVLKFFDSDNMKSFNKSLSRSRYQPPIHHELTLASWIQENMVSYLIGTGVGYLHPPGQSIPVDFRVLSLSLIFQGSRCKSPELFRKLFLSTFPHKNTANIASLQMETGYTSSPNPIFMRRAIHPSKSAIHYSVLLNEFWDSSLPTFDHFKFAMKDFSSVHWTRYAFYYHARQLLRSPDRLNYEDSCRTKIEDLGSFLWTKRNVRAFSAKWQAMYAGKLAWSFNLLYKGHTYYRRSERLLNTTLRTSKSFFQKIWAIIKSWFRKGRSEEPADLPFSAGPSFSETFDVVSAPLSLSSCSDWKFKYISAPNTKLLILSGSMNQVIPASEANAIAKNSLFESIDYFKFWRGGHALFSHMRSCAQSLLTEHYNFTDIPWNINTIWPKVSRYRKMHALSKSSDDAIRTTISELLHRRELKLMLLDYLQPSHLNSSDEKLHNCDDPVYLERCFSRSPVFEQPDTSLQRDSNSNSYCLVRYIHPRVLDSFQGFGLDEQEIEALTTYWRRSHSCAFEPYMTFEEQESWLHRCERPIKFNSVDKLFVYDYDPYAEGLVIDPPHDIARLIAKMESSIKISKKANVAMKKFRKLYIYLDSEILLENRLFRRFFYRRRMYSDVSLRFNWYRKLTPETYFCDLGENGKLEDQYFEMAEKYIAAYHMKNTSVDPRMHDSWRGSSFHQVPLDVLSKRISTFHRTSPLGQEKPLIHLLQQGLTEDDLRDMSLRQKILDQRDLSIWPRHCLTIQTLTTHQRLRELNVNASLVFALPSSAGDPSTAYYSAYNSIVPSLSKLRIESRPTLEDAFMSLASRLDDGPRQCCEAVNYDNFLDWHQVPLLSYLGLSASYSSQRPHGSSVGLFDEPEQVNWTALIIGVVLGAALFLIICLFACKKILQVVAKQEEMLKRKLKRRRKWIKLQRKLRILNYLNDQHLLVESLKQGSISADEFRENSDLPLEDEDVEQYVALSSALDQESGLSYSSCESFFSDLSDSSSADSECSSPSRRSIAITGKSSVELRSKPNSQHVSSPLSLPGEILSRHHGINGATPIWSMHPALRRSHASLSALNLKYGKMSPRPISESLDSSSSDDMSANNFSDSDSGYDYYIN